MEKLCNVPKYNNQYITVSDTCKRMARKVDPNVLLAQLLDITTELVVSFAAKEDVSKEICEEG